MSQEQLARRLGLFSATVVAVSGMVGGGIFVNPSLVAARLGGAGEGALLGAWIAGGALALCGAFVFAELSTVVPRVGGPYAFYREAFHPAVGFLYGWTLLLVISTSAVAAMAVVLAEHLIALLGWPPAWSGALAVAILLALTAYHALGVQAGALLLNVLTTTKMVAIAALVIAALSSEGAARGGAAGSTATPGPSAFLGALVPIMFAYGGWQNLNFIAEEVRDPLRNLPRAVLGAVALVIVVYLGANAAYLHVLSGPGLAQTHTPAADVAGAVWGPLGRRVIGAMIALSVFGYLNLALLSAPRVYYAMAADGLFFAALARVHPRFRSPVWAIALQGGLGAAMALSATYGALVNLAVFGDWVFYTLSGVALIRLRRLRPEAPRPYPARGYPLTPVLFSVSGALLVGNQLLLEPRTTALAALAVAAGVPVYLAWSSHNAKRAADRASG